MKTPSHEEPLKPESVEEILKEFDTRFTPDWWMGFGTSNDIDKLGISGIRDFLSQALTKSYTAGRSSMRQDVLSVVPENILDNGHKRIEQEPTEDEKAFNDGYNLFRSQLLTNIEGIV